jgi:hypothetical protein
MASASPDDVAGSDLPIELELRSERLASMTLATKRLEELLAGLESFEEARGPAVKELLQHEAREQLWKVIVQREALGIYHHEVLFDALRVPRELRLHVDWREWRKARG